MALQLNPRPGLGLLYVYDLIVVITEPAGQEGLLEFEPPDPPIQPTYPPSVIVPAIAG
jgi:hypothetical protein